MVVGSVFQHFYVKEIDRLEGKLVAVFQLDDKALRVRLKARDNTASAVYSLI